MLSQAGRRPPGGCVGGQPADVVQVPVANEGAVLQGGPMGAPPQVEGHLPGKETEKDDVYGSRTRAAHADAHALVSIGALCCRSG
jgi:hypothetical protein